MVDILLPLGNGSNSNNDELRIALRSIDKYLDVDNIYIITTEKLDWLRNATIVPVMDLWSTNKDKNLINKIVTTLNKYPTIDDFILWMDDTVLLKEMEAEKWPKIYNDRNLDFFKQYGTTKWHKRVENTLSILKLGGFDVSCNWESHTPLKFNGKNIRDNIYKYNYDMMGANYTIFTLFACIDGYKRKDGVTQDSIKCTCERSGKAVDTTKSLLGYNNAAFLSGLRENLFNMFPDHCKYEIEYLYDNITVAAYNTTDLDKFSQFLDKKYKNIVTLDEISYNSLKNKYKITKSDYNSVIQQSEMTIFYTDSDKDNLSKYININDDIALTVNTSSLDRAVALKSNVSIESSTPEEVYKELIDKVRPTIINS